MPASRKFNLVGHSPAEVYAWVKTTGAGRRSHIGVWYSRKAGGVVVSLQEGVEALDELYWDAPGPRLAFGAAVDGGTVHPFFADIIQYEKGDLLVATT